MLQYVSHEFFISHKILKQNLILEIQNDFKKYSFISFQLLVVVIASKYFNF